MPWFARGAGQGLAVKLEEVGGNGMSVHQESYPRFQGNLAKQGKRGWGQRPRRETVQARRGKTAEQQPEQLFALLPSKRGAKSDSPLDLEMLHVEGTNPHE